MLATDMLLADPVTDSILRFDGDDGTPLGPFVESGAGGLVDPHDPTFGPDGDLYVFSGLQTASPQVLQYAGDTGMFLGVFANVGGSALEFGPDGNLYVATNTATGVLRFDGDTGASLGVAAAGNGIRRAAGLDFGHDGNLYVLDSDGFIDTFADRILRFDLAGGFIDQFVDPGVMDDVADFTVGPDGHLYVPDVKPNVTWRFSGTTGEPLGAFAIPPQDRETGFQVSFGSDGNAYVASSIGVLQFEGEIGNFIGEFVTLAAGTITFLPQLPAADLAVSIVEIPAGALLGRELSISYSVTNNSTATTPVSDWTDVIYLSSDDVFDPSDFAFGRIVRNSEVLGNASYNETFTRIVPAIPLGEYHIFVFADRRGEVTDSSRSNNLSKSLGTLRVLPPPASTHDPVNSIAVGRTMSAYTTADTGSGELAVTYTVYNLTDGYAQDVMLTTTLADQVSIASTSQSPDQQGETLSWSLGTLAPFGRASVEVSLTLLNGAATQIDLGPQAFSTIDGVAVMDNLSAATLRTDQIDDEALAATIDANAEDPFVQAKAAELDQDPNRIFEYLANEISFESYVGSSRGARGTLWSGAGNALDVASLGVALIRASGIPAQYVSGELSETEARNLVASMFPPITQAIGTIAPETMISDPINDATLIQESQEHYWFQFDAGGGMVHADPLTPDSFIGQMPTTPLSTFVEVDDSLREKTQVKVIAESFGQATALLTLTNGLSNTVVLEHTFSNVELVGRTVTVGHFVDTLTLGALTFTSTTHTYAPYLILIDQAFADPNREEIIRGSDFQEVYTNFPLGNQVLAGLFLEVTLSGPNGPDETLQRTLADRIGFAARQGFASAAVTIEPGADPIVSATDLYTISSLAGSQSIAPSSSLIQALHERQSQFNNLNPVSVSKGEPPTRTTITETITLLANVQLVGFLAEAARLASYYSEVTNVKAYFARPRVTIFSAQFNSDRQATELALDLRRETMRVFALPGQNVEAVAAFNQVRGVNDNFLEAEFVPSPFGSEDMGTIAILAEAERHGIPLITLRPGDTFRVSTLAISDQAKARISFALQSGLQVVVPEHAVEVAGALRVSWFEVDPVTGETYGVLESGIHSDLTEYPGGLGGTQPPQNTVLFTNATPVNSGLAFTESGGGMSILVQASTNGSRYVVEQLARLAEKAFLAAATGVAPPDPPLTDALFTLTSESLPNIAGTSVDVNPPPTSTTVTADAEVAAISVSGDFSTQWSTAGTSTSVIADRVDSLSAMVTDGSGNPVGTGSVSIAKSSQSISIGGMVDYGVSGTGRLAFHPRQQAELFAAANWQEFVATLSGTITISLVSDGVELNGSLLAPGTYTISTANVEIVGNGTGLSPRFSSAATLSVANANVELERGTGSVTIRGVGLDPSNRILTSDFSGGLVVVPAGSSGYAIELDGAAGEFLSVSADSSEVTANQIAGATFQPTVDSSFQDDFDVTVVAPPNWIVSIDEDNEVTVVPAPGTQQGTYSIELTAISRTNPELRSVGNVQVDVIPTAAGVSLLVEPEFFFFVDAFGGQLPSTFRATTQNEGPDADFFNVTITNAPQGFDVITTVSELELPAGELGVFGVYLIPVSLMPPQGTTVSFDVTVTSETDEQITETITIEYSIPEVHGVQFLPSPSSVATTPGVATSVDVQIASVGNIGEQVSFEVNLSDGLELQGLANLTLAVGEVVTQPLVFTPSIDTPLNTTLEAVITISFGGREPIRISIPVRVAAPGADSAVQAAVAVRDLLSNGVLATRLTDLGETLTALVQMPANQIFRDQSISSINGIIAQLTNEPDLADCIDPLTTARDTLAAASTPAEIQSAIETLGDVLDDFAAKVTVLARHNFNLSLFPNRQTGRPTVPVDYAVRVQNVGSQTTTYDLNVSGVPGTVTSQFADQSLTIEPGQFGETILTLTQLPNADLTTFEFIVQATVDGADPELSRESIGVFQARRNFVSVTDVTATPPFGGTGTEFEITTTILNAVNREQEVLVSFTVLDPNDQPVFTSTPVPATLTVATSVLDLDLGTFDSTGLEEGQYTIEVTVTDTLDEPIPGAVGEESLLIGTPITASLSVDPAQLPPGNNVVTNTLQIDAVVPPSAVFELVGQLIQRSDEDMTLVDAFDINIFGDLAYVATSREGLIVDISDPANPTTMRIFGFNKEYERIGDVLVGRNTPSGGIGFFIYSLADPTNPTLTGGIQLNYLFASDFILDGEQIYLSTNLEILQSGNITELYGDVISHDTNRLGGVLPDDVLFNTFGTTTDGDEPFGIPRNGGPFNMFGLEMPDDNTLYVASTTATGDVVTTDENGDPAVGVVRIVDVTDPTDILQAGLVEIPGTTMVQGVTIDGNRAYVVGTQGGWRDPFTTVSDIGPEGDLVVAVLDITDIHNPTVIGTPTVIDRAARGNTGLQYVADGRFVLGSIGEFEVDTPQLLMINASDPANVFIEEQIDAPGNVRGNRIEGNLLYTSTDAGLFIYSLGVPDIPVVAEVQVPNGTGVEVVAGSFNVEPTEVIEGTGFDTLVWELTLDQAVASQTLTWSTTVSELQPGETRMVTLGSSLEFTSQGTDGQLTLPPTSVFADQILALDPTTLTRVPGETATFTVTIDNPATIEASYDLAVVGVDATWVTIASQVTVPAGESLEVPLTITSDLFAAQADYGFVVTATIDGVSGAIEGTLTLEGVPVLPEIDPDSHGVVVQVTPQQATAGQGTSAAYTVRITNTGSVTDTFTLSSDLAAAFGVSFASSTLVVPPGASNFRETTLIVTPQVGTIAGSVPFTIFADSSLVDDLQDTDNATLIVSPLGVSATLTPESGPDGITYTLTVTNTGNQADTFDIAVAAPVALVATLETNEVTLPAGASTTIDIEVATIDFAFPGGLPLVGVATSQTNSQVRDADSATVLVASFLGLDAAFQRDFIALPQPGSTSLLLLVDNLGNLEDNYSATIMSTTGPLSVSINGLDGSPTQTIPIFRLPGLSSGALLLNANLLDEGVGTVTVMISSNDNELSRLVTATIQAESEQEVADLSLAKTVDIQAPQLGETVTYTLTLSNDGPSAATNIEVTDLLPGGLSFVGAATQFGSYNEVSGVWSVGDLQNQSVATLQIMALVDETTQIVNIAEVTAVDQFDPDSTAGNGADGSQEDDFATAEISQCLYGLSGALQVGLNTLIYACATPGSLSAFAMGTEFGEFTFSQYDVTVGLANPEVKALGVANAEGVAVVHVNVPEARAGSHILFQAFEIAPNQQLSNVLTLNVANVPLLSTAEEGNSTVAVTRSEISDLFNEAVSRWVATGLTDSQLARLQDADFRLLDLPAGVLGSTLGTTIFLDRTAAGHEWFVDSTAADDSEFELALSAQERITTTSAAIDRIDLLTVMMHELGHVLGQSDQDQPGGAAGLMHHDLPAGTRRLPTDLAPASISRPLLNSDMAEDVNHDGLVTLTDALDVVSHLRQHGSRRAADILRELRGGETDSFDVTGDNLVSLNDALAIVARLRLLRSLEGELLALNPANKTSVQAKPSLLPNELLRGENWEDTDSLYEESVDLFLASYTSE